MAANCSTTQIQQVKNDLFKLGNNFPCYQHLLSACGLFITLKTWPHTWNQSWPSMFLKSYCFVSELGRSDRSAVLPEVEQPQDEHLGRVREAEDQRELRRRDARVGRSKNHQVPSDPPVCRQRVSAVSRALNDARFFVLWTEILKK